MPKHDKPTIAVRRSKKPAVKQASNENSDSDAADNSFEIQNSVISDSVKYGTEFGDDDASSQDFNGEFSKLLERFKADMNKSMQVKRKKLEQFTEQSIRTTMSKVLETSKNQSFERRKLINNFQLHFMAMIQQGEKELEKIRDAEEKMQNVLAQRQKKHKKQKSAKQVRADHSQRAKVMKHLSEVFCKGMNEMEESHVEQYSAVQNELHKEMALLEKKVLLETRQQGMNARK